MRYIIFFVCFFSFCFADEFLPLLTLYPEEQITLSAESKAYLNSPAFLEKERLKNSQIFERRKEVYDAFLLLLFVPFSAVFLFWLYVEYNLGARVYAWLTPKQDPILGLMGIVNDPKRAPQERWIALSKLARAKIGSIESKYCMNMTNQDLVQVIDTSKNIPLEIKSTLDALVATLDLFCFAPGSHDEEAWQRDKNFLIDINSSNIHRSDKRNDQ
jgi:hypothetical protein